jgi:hypothetical protein
MVMGPFWSSLFEHLKDCGRNATLFILTLGGLLVLLCLVAIICSTELHKYLLPGLPAIGVLALAWVGVVIRRARARRRQRLERSPLSRDELRVARSKLMKDVNRVSHLWVLL